MNYLIKQPNLRQFFVKFLHLILKLVLSLGLLHTHTKVGCHPLELTVRAWRVSPAEIQSPVSCSENFHRQTFSQWSSLTTDRNRPTNTTRQAFTMLRLQSEATRFDGPVPIAFYFITVVEPSSCNEET